MHPAQQPSHSQSQRLVGTVFACEAPNWVSAETIFAIGSPLLTYDLLSLSFPHTALLAVHGIQNGPIVRHQQHPCVTPHLYQSGRFRRANPERRIRRTLIPRALIMRLVSGKHPTKIILLPVNRIVTLALNQGQYRLIREPSVLAPHQ